ncbi:MAG: hypothetical protein ACR2OO_03955 [Thermomicrobiales bacterium]
MHKRVAPPRINHLAILGVLPLILAAPLTGSVQRIAPVALAALVLFPT